MRTGLVTESNWRDTFKYKRCQTCDGHGTLDCSLCGKHSDDCECTTVPRTFKICDQCDGEGNVLQVKKEDIH